MSTVQCLVQHFVSFTVYMVLCPCRTQEESAKQTVKGTLGEVVEVPVLQTRANTMEKKRNEMEKWTAFAEV